MWCAVFENVIPICPHRFLSVSIYTFPKCAELEFGEPLTP